MIKESQKARWKGKTVDQLENLMVKFLSVVCRTKEEAAAIQEAVQVLDDLIKEKLTGVK